jgi:hypothetical protein
MRKSLVILIVGCCLILGVACSCKKENIHTAAQNKAHDPCSTRNEYFPPPGSTWAGNGLHWGADENSWESNLLRHMQEPSLYACSGADDEPVYRFLWDRSLSEPIVARLTVHKDGTGTLIIHMLASNGIPLPPKPGQPPTTLDQWFRIKSEEQIAVTPEQVKHVLVLFNGINFWNVDPSKGETTDGSDWIFESKVEGRYRLIDFRNMPSKSANDCGLYLVLGLGKLAIPPGAIY